MTLLQLKACLLIAMLAGHEAKRITDISGSMAAMQAETPAEEDFQKLNKECGWSIFGGCTGEACAWRRLSKDWPPPSSQSCRHTDQFMLTQNGPANYKIMVGLLAAKSAKYKADCNGATIFNRGCARRHQQMTRAIKFIAKAESNAELMRGLTEEDKTANKESFQQSLDNLASTMGSHGTLVLQLAEKMKADPATKKDPKVAVEKMVGIVHKLTLGSTAEQEAAEQTIQELEASPELDEAETRAAEENANKIAAQLTTEDDITEVLEELDVVAPDNNNDDTLLGGNTSLLQVKAQGLGASIIAFVLLATLLVIVVVMAVVEVIAAIVAWAFLAILGCGAYAVGRDEGKASADKVGFTGFGKCFLKVFAFPFVIIGTAAMATYYYFKPKSAEVSNLQLSAPGAPSLVQTDVQVETTHWLYYDVCYWTSKYTPEMVTESCAWHEKSIEVQEGPCTQKDHVYEATYAMGHFPDNCR